MGDLTLVQETLANATTPAAGSGTIFFDSATGTPKYKDSNGLAHSMGGQTGVYDVTAYGLVGDGVTDNLAAINTLLNTTAANGSIIYFPAGTYNFSAAIAVGAHRFYFQGAGAIDTVLRTTSATADLFALTDGNWYSTWADLGFSSTVNKTAGAMINTGTAAGSGNVGTHVRRCNFSAAGSGTYLFNGIVFNGTQAANTTFVEDCTFTNFSNYGVSLVANTSSNNTAASLVLNNVVMNGNLAAGNALACVQITQAGAVQIDNCDLIGAVNNILGNPATGSPVQGIFSLYCTNTYFDNSAGSCVKFTGSGNVERCKFTGCSFTVAGGSTSYSAFEISTTGTLLTTGFDLLACTFANTFGNTGAATNGILITGCTDINIEDCSIAGWTNGIQITPAGAAGVTKVWIKNNVIGAVGNIAANTNGIVLNAGSFTYGQIVIQGNTLTNTTAQITDNSTMGTGTAATGIKSIQSNTGTIVSAPVANVAATAIPLTTVTNVDSRGGLWIPANARVGSSGRITVFATNAATVQTLTATLRYGVNNSASDAAILTQAYTAGTAVVGSGKFVVEWEIVSTTTMVATLFFINGNNAATGIAGQASPFQLITSMTVPVTIATNVNNWLGLYFSSATAAAITVRSVKYEVQSQ